MSLQTLKYAYFDTSSKTFTSLDDIPPEQEWAKYSSVGELFLVALEKNAAKVIIVDYNTGNEFTGQQILETSKKIATFFLKNGINPQDVIYNYLPNTFLYACIYVAIQLIGCIFSGIVYQHPKREVLASVQRVDAKVITCFHGNHQIAEEVADETNSVQLIILVDESVTEEYVTKGGKRVVPISNILQEEYNVDDKLLPVKVDQSSTSCLVHSSGTTGHPKGIIRSQRNNLYMFHQNFLHTGVNFFPFAHISGFSCLGGALVTGRLTVLQWHWDLEKWLDCVQRYKLTKCIMVPVQSVLIARSPLTSNYDLSSLQLVHIGGAPVTLQAIKAFKALTGVPQVGEFYAASEMGLVGVPVFSDSFTAAGRLAPGVKVRVLDFKTGEFVGLRKEGEVCVQTMELSPGYYKSDKKMKDEFIDGFFQTGDTGYVNEDGVLFLVSRLKELIKVGGNQVPPRELETILLEHESVDEAAVAGTPDDIYGQLPRAFVVLKPDGPPVSEDQLKEYVDSKVGSYKRLQGGLVFVKSIPKIGIGKIDRKKLLEIYPRQ